MEIELFKKNYTSTMMRIVKRYADMEANTITHLVINGNHNQIIKAITQMKNLAEAKMLLEAYEACDICFEPDCQGHIANKIKL